MSELDISKIENAFLPSKEISTADRFAGRLEEVRSAYFALHSEGTNIAIIGNRGIGKTSLARQIVNIASGDNRLLQKLNIRHSTKLDFLPIYFACGGSVKTFHDLLQRLLTTKGCLADWVDEIPSLTKETNVIEPKLDVKVASLGGKLQTEYESRAAISSHTIDTIFTNTVITIAKQDIAKDGILIVLDEFDRIEDPTGFADFIKALATNAPDVKFCLVGVAQDIQFLMKEHASADRLFAGSIVTMPAMNPSELMEIIDIAEKSIDGKISFTKAAKHEIVNLAQGHPYMVHLIGKHALWKAFDENKSLIDSKDVEHALRHMAQRKADPVLEGRYKKAIGTSAQREVVLKALAKKCKSDGEILTIDAYTLAMTQQVDNPSQYVGQLVTEERGSEIVKVRDRVYRFRDSLFLAYVNARPRYFSDENFDENIMTEAE